jgi:alpha-aminoadipic semialdehyde synthase
MQIFKDVGLLENTHKFSISTWDDLLHNTLSTVTGTPMRAGDKASFRAAVSDLLGPRNEFALRVLSETGLIPVNDTHKSQSGVAAVLVRSQTAIEHFAHLLSAQLGYKANERDMVVLSHEIVSHPKDLISANPQDEMLYSSSLVVTGTPSTGESAMSRTVGLPLAFATLEVLDGKVQSRGVLGGKEVWRAVLDGMGQVGIHMRESITPLRNEQRQSRTVENQLLDNRKRFSN